ACDEAEPPRPVRVGVRRGGSLEGSLRRDAAGGLVERTDRIDSGRRRYPDGIVYDSTSLWTQRIRDDDPLSAEARFDQTTGIGRGEWQTRVETSSRLTSDRERFLATASVAAYEGEVPIFSRTWTFHT